MTDLIHVMMGKATSNDIISPVTLVSTSVTATNILFMNSTIFWDITPCSPLRVNRHFGGTYRLHLQGRKISRERHQRESRWQAEGNAAATSRPHDLFILFHLFL
jgi:hypothetical protein